MDEVHNVWRPQIVYDVHQMGTTGARMYVPPWTDPIDPNIDPLITQQVNAFGLGMAADLTAAGKTGVVVNGIYDYFTPARHYQSYHGGLRLLSESASARFASPVTTPFSTLQTRARGYNAQESSWNFLEPWSGGTWRLRDIVDYQLIAFESVLYQAALKRVDLLENFHRIFQRVMSRPGPEAFVIPRNQHDPTAAARMLRTLGRGMVEVERAQSAFRADGVDFAEGDVVVRMQQPSAAFARTLLEQQRYPDLREYPGGPPRRPYDVTAHSLPLLMGVEARPVRRLPADVNLSALTDFTPAGRVSTAEALRLSTSDSNAFIAVNRLLKAGVEVFRDRRVGDFLFSRMDAGPEQLDDWARELGLRFEAADAAPGRQLRVSPSRIGLYAGVRPSMDEGWTRWLLEQFEFNLVPLDNRRLQDGALHTSYDVIILPDAAPSALHAGYVEGATYSGAKPPPVATGGIEDAGAVALRRFAESGGTILAFNRASSYAVERLNLPVENVLDGVSNRQFYAPGSLLNVVVEAAEPLAWGMRGREAVWFESGPAFRIQRKGSARNAPRALLRYPGRDVLASGWLLGEQYLAGHAAVVECPVGSGRVVLFGIRPQYRGQSNATFRLAFNALFGA